MCRLLVILPFYRTRRPFPRLATTICTECSPQCRQSKFTSIKHIFEIIAVEAYDGDSSAALSHPTRSYVSTIIQELQERVPDLYELFMHPGDVYKNYDHEVTSYIESVLFLI